jgi:lysozyme family protein
MALFEKFASTVAQFEAGYQNHPNDQGNYNSLGQLVGTNYGISAAFYEAVFKVIPSATTIQSITKNQAKQLFKNHFWDKLFADSIQSQAVAETFVDHGINAGNKSATSIMQETLIVDFGRGIEFDQIMGSETLNAINSVDGSQLFASFNKRREAYYRSLGNVNFIQGWLKRVKDITDKFNMNVIFNPKVIGTVLFVLMIAGYGYYTYVDQPKTPKQK